MKENIVKRMEFSSKNSSPDKNINWINASKAICIILVFLRHSEGYYGANLGWFDDLYLTIYVNGFFFVSGYLLFWKQLSEPRVSECKLLYISKKGGGGVLLCNVLFRIVFPSILFSAIEFLPSCLIQNRNINLEYALLKTVGGMTYWFTSALAVAELILLALFCTRKRNIWFYVIVVAIIGSIGLFLARIDLRIIDLWAWKRGLIAIIFLAIGGIYWKYEHQLESLCTGSLLFPVVLVYLVIVLFLRNYSNPLVSLRSIQPLGFVTSIIGCLLLVRMCKKLPVRKPLTFIGKNSLGFYFLSGALPITLSKIAHLTLHETCLWLMFVIWIACLMIAFAMVMLLNRFLPWIWDLRKANVKII